MKRVYYIKLADARVEAAKLARELKGREVLALIGPLGSGKTTFTKALAKALKVRNKVTSPTFTLMHVFEAKLRGSKPGALYHLDLYRTKNFREVSALGLTEIWTKPGIVTVIEWADKIKKHLPKKTTFLYFSHE